MSRIVESKGYVPFSIDEILQKFYQEYKILTGQSSLTFNQYVGTAAYQFAEYLARGIIDIQDRISLGNSFILEDLYDANEAILSQKNCVNGSTFYNFKDVCLGLNYDFITDNIDNKYKLEINIDTPLNDSKNPITNDDFTTNCEKLKNAFAYSAHDLAVTAGSSIIAITDINSITKNANFNYINSSMLATNYTDKGYLTLDVHIQFVTRHQNDSVIVNNIVSDFRESFGQKMLIGASIYPEVYLYPYNYNCADFVTYFKISGSTDPWQTGKIECGKQTKCVLASVISVNVPPIN